jgi:hypothetical protein
MQIKILGCCAAVALLQIAAAAGAQTKEMAPGSDNHHPGRIVSEPLNCKLVGGAATSAPANVQADAIQQIVVSSTDAVPVEALSINAWVQLANHQVYHRSVSTETTLYNGQWRSIGEIKGARFCQATMSWLILTRRQDANSP